MSRSMTLGRYLPGESPLHHLSPLLKIPVLVVILVTLFSLRTFPALLGGLACALACFLLARIPLRYTLRGLQPIFYIALFALLVYVFFTGGGVVWFKLGPLTVESVGVYTGLFVVTRLIVLVLFSLLLTLTTTPLALTGAMAFYLRPLQRLGLPAEEISLVMAVAMRFIPTLLEESQRLMRAQQARGADFLRGSLPARARSLVPLIVPLFVSAFRRADDLALAMEARGYRVGARRTRMHEERVRPRDWLVLAAALTLLALALVLHW